MDPGSNIDKLHYFIKKNNEQGNIEEALRIKR